MHASIHSISWYKWYIKNYYLGREDVWNLSLAQLFEEVSRILFTYIVIQQFHYLPMTYLVSIAILAMSIGELTSILFLMLRLKRKINWHYHPISYFQKHFIFKDMMNIALPLTGSRLLHVCYNFLEPILLVSILTKLHIGENQIHLQYAIINGYVISLLVTPTFFNNVVLRLLIPILNKDIAYNRLEALKNMFFIVWSSVFLSVFLLHLYFIFMAMSAFKSCTIQPKVIVVYNTCVFPLQSSIYKHL